MRTISEIATALTPQAVAVRRDLHRHPEIAFEEHRTMGIVVDRLRALGLSPRANLGKTGVVAVWDSGKPGPTVLVRADMDALPVPEEKTVEYKSTIEGKMHACGHDGHTAILLGVAETLLERGAGLRGRLVFVFQPAEEIVRGASAMLADGALDGLSIDHVVGLHLSSNTPLGSVSVREGPAMAATDSYRLVVKGRGGHAAYPQGGIDPIVISAQVILALQTIVSRNVDPVDKAVISITSIHAGTAYNIIPESVELKGTLRTFDPETRTRLRARILEVAEGVCKLHGGAFESEWFEGTPAVVNDAESTVAFRRVAAGILGEENVKESPQIMGGDDMALWLQQAKGCYFFVGSSSSDATSVDHHNPRFDIDERSLTIGIEVLSAAAEERLANG